MDQLFFAFIAKLKELYMKDRIDGMLTHAENAILVVDMQNAWVLPSSRFHVAGAYATLPAIAQFLDYGRAHDWAIIYICRIHRPSGIDAELFRRHFFEEGHPVCIEGTPDAAICDAIKPKHGDIFVEKQRFSGFFQTDLDIVLRGLGVKNVYVTGTQYPNCVRGTAVDAMCLDYITTVVTDCCSAASEEVAEANIYDIRNMGIPCVPSTDIMK